MSQPPFVNKDHLLKVLVRLRDFRKWAVLNSIDPWATRQGLITVLELDTQAGLLHKIEPQQLAEFDMKARLHALAFLREAGIPIPEEKN